MDEFGVLVESIGFKVQGKSAPMADLKTKTDINRGNSRDFGFSSGFNTKPTSVNRPKSVYNSNSINGYFDDDVNGISQSSNNRKSEDFGGFDDVFGGSIKILKSSGADGFDLDSIFKVNSSVYHEDDIFGGTPGLKNSTTVNIDDVFGSMASFPKQSAPIEDLFGKFGEMGLASNGSRKKLGKAEKNAQKFHDLIPGFSGSSTSRNGENTESSWSTLSSGFSSKSTSTSAEDPFVILEQSSSQTYTSSRLFSEPVEQDAGKSSILSSFDELEGFAMGKVQNKANEQYSHSQKEGTEAATHDLDSFFGMGAEPSSGSMRKSTMVDPLFDSLFQSRENPGAEQTPSGSLPSRKKAPFTTNIVDDFPSFFPEVTPSSGEFQETEGESEERRRARLNHHMRTQQRMAKALAEKNQRDVQTQWEQEERHRIAETLDDIIKRWAAGKEGNLRALLSSLQYVLWPECGWQQVSLTDLITSVSVKKVYYKATLCVHPDKVQQKGANIEQKYIAEKVFDVLKEAWNKFNAEEL